MKRVGLALLGAAVCVGACTSNSAPSPIAGTWSGTMTYLDASVPIEFVLAADGGVVSGQQVLFDPTTGAAVGVGIVTGQASGTSATWSGVGGGITVTGNVQGGSFTGTGALPAPDGGTLTVAISLAQGQGSGGAQ